MKLNTFNIALSFDHLRHPFTPIKKERVVPRYEKKELFKTIIRFLGDVASNSKNKMNAEALASMFAPNLINIDDITSIEVQGITKKLNIAIQFLIEHQNNIFEK